MQEGLYRLCQLPIPFQYINKLFFNLQSLTDYLWKYILDHDFINKITTPYSSPLPKEKFWIRAYDVEPIINWRRVSLSFQRLWIKTATLFSGSHPTYRSAIFPFIFDHAQLDTRCLSISETYGKASPFACRKTLCFMQSSGH